MNKFYHYNIWVNNQLMLSSVFIPDFKGYTTATEAQRVGHLKAQENGFSDYNLVIKSYNGNLQRL